MNLIAHFVAFIAPLVLCWGAFTALLWTLDQYVPTERYAVKAGQYILAALLVFAAALLTALAVCSVFVPLVP